MAIDVSATMLNVLAESEGIEVSATMLNVLSENEGIEVSATMLNALVDGAMVYGVRRQPMIGTF